MSDVGEPKEASAFTVYKDAFSGYENGKERRYQLLFAVNGGVLAIANISPINWQNLFLACLMIYFTVIMTDDIREFGKKFHALYPDLFGPAGERVLKNIRVVLCLAWIGVILSMVLVWIGWAIVPIKS